MAKLAVVPLLLFLVQLMPTVAAKDFWAHQNSMSSSSFFKNKTVIPNWPKARPPGCQSMPWICERGAPPMTRMRCCQNQCVDVLSDPNHCRSCKRRCPFTWQCCEGRCIDANNDPYNCGRCGNVCPFGAPCEFGMCGYAQSYPPRRPYPPKRRPRPPPTPQFKNNGDI